LGGGGQPFFATAGGKDASGLQQAVDKARTVVGDRRDTGPSRPAPMFDAFGIVSLGMWWCYQP